MEISVDLMLNSFSVDTYLSIFDFKSNELYFVGDIKSLYSEYYFNSSQVDTLLNMVVKYSTVQNNTLRLEI